MRIRCDDDSSRLHYPDGTAMLISYGIQRARYRESQTREMLITPGETYKYTIRVWPTSNLFKVGHRIRLEVSSSNFPMFDRNPNTGHPSDRTRSSRSRIRRSSTTWITGR
ncbi:MAG: CocE/NonD family hydrolase C-terminal non-catalytic domain-containing protein [Acidobacteriota bacterium]